MGTFFQHQFVRPGTLAESSEVRDGAEPSAGLLSAGVELQINPARGMRIRVVPSVSLESELFIAVRRLNRPTVLKSDCTNVREGLVRYGIARPYPD